MYFHSPVCLFVGKDHEFLARLRETFGSRLAFEEVAPQDVSLCASAHAQIAVFLWNRHARDEAEKLSHRFPYLKVLIEQNHRSFQGDVPKNGYTAMVERSQDRCDLVEEIEKVLQATAPKPVPSLTPLPARDIDLVSWVERLPEILATLKQPEKMGDALLASLLGAFQSQKGVIHLFERNLCTVHSRGMERKKSELARQGELIQHSHVHSIAVAAGEHPTIDGVFASLGCNVLILFRHDNTLLGSAILNVAPGHFGNRNQLEKIGLIVAELLFLLQDRERSKAASIRTSTILNTLSGATLWIDEAGLCEFVQGDTSLFAGRGQINGAHYECLRSASLKNAICKMFSEKVGPTRCAKVQVEEGVVVYRTGNCIIVSKSHEMIIPPSTVHAPVENTEARTTRTLATFLAQCAAIKGTQIEQLTSSLQSWAVDEVACETALRKIAQAAEACSPVKLFIYCCEKNPGAASLTIDVHFPPGGGRLHTLGSSSPHNQTPFGFRTTMDLENTLHQGSTGIQAAKIVLQKGPQEPNHVSRERAKITPITSPHFVKTSRCA